MSKTSDEFREKANQPETSEQSDASKVEVKTKRNRTKAVKKVEIDIDDEFIIQTEDGDLFDSETNEMIPPMAYNKDGQAKSFLHPTVEQIQSSVIYMAVGDILLSNTQYAKYNLSNRKNWLRIKIYFNRDYGGAPVEVSKIQLFFPYVSHLGKLNSVTFDLAIASNQREAVPVVLPLFVVAELSRKGYKSRYAFKNKPDDELKSLSIAYGEHNTVYENAQKSPLIEIKSSLMLHEGKSKSGGDKPFYSIFMCDSDDDDSRRELTVHNFVSYDGCPNRILTEEEILETRRAKITKQHAIRG